MRQNGGKRNGAGRPVGAKTCAKVALATAVDKAKAIKSIQDIIGDGETPFEYIIDVMRNPTHDPRLRLDAAKDAATYCYKRLPTDSNVKIEGELEHSVEIYFPGLPKHDS